MHAIYSLQTPYPGPWTPGAGRPLLYPSITISYRPFWNTADVSLSHYPFSCSSIRHNVLWTLCVVEYKPEKISQDYFCGGCNGERKQLCSLWFPSNEFWFMQKYPSLKPCAHLLVHRGDRLRGLLVRQALRCTMAFPNGQQTLRHLNSRHRTAEQLWSIGWILKTLSFLAQKLICNYWPQRKRLWKFLLLEMI